MDLIFIVFWSLVVWRVTALFVTDAITAPIRDRIGIYYDERSRRQGKNFFARMLMCHRCTSVWVAAGLMLLYVHKFGFWDTIPIVLMLSAGSIIINKFVEG